jgi:hypothetical protein
MKEFGIDARTARSLNRGMRILLALLMCLVFGTTQCFALKGGPPYPNGGNIKGTYAGIMQGVFDPTNPRSSNTLGLFSFVLPESGFATGTVVFFVAGRTFTGTVSGVGDPNKGKLRGVVQSTVVNKVVVCDRTTTPLGTVVIENHTTDVTDRADGTLDATITPSSKAGSSVNGTLLKGTGFVTATQSVTDPADCTAILVNSSPLSLLVDGFKQSTNTTTTQ